MEVTEITGSVGSDSKGATRAGRGRWIAMLAGAAVLSLVPGPLEAQGEGMQLARMMPGRGGPGRGPAGPGPGALVWKGTAKEGEKSMPARMFLDPPPREGAEGRRRKGPPGLLWIGDRPVAIKPTHAEVDEAESEDETSVTSDAGEQVQPPRPPRPPRLRKLEADLMLPPPRGKKGEAPAEPSGEPTKIGTLTLSIDPDSEDPRSGKVTGIATITDPESGETHTFTLEGKVKGPPRGERPPRGEQGPRGERPPAPGARPAPRGDTSDAGAIESGTSDF